MASVFHSEGLKASAEIAKQMITLSSGAVAFTVTFLDKFTAQVEGRTEVPRSLYVAWALFGLTIIFAVWTLMAINGHIDALDRHANGWELNAAQKEVAVGRGTSTKLPAVLMLFTFLIAVAVMSMTGLRLRP